MGNLFTPLDSDNAIFSLMQNTDKLIHHQLDELRRELIAPIICDLIQEGIEKGVFKELKNSRIISMIVFDGINESMHRLYDMQQSKEHLPSTISGIKELFKLILGVDFSFEN